MTAAKQRDWTFWYFSLLFFVSLASSLYQAYFVNSPLDHLYSDMNGYVERAARLADGGPFGIFDSFYPPGTSELYALFFYLLGYQDGLRALVPFQVLLISVANVLFAWATYLLYHSKRLSVAVFACLVLYWPFSAQALFFMAEPAFIFSLGLALLLYISCVRGHCSLLKMLGLGVVLSFSILVKTQGLFLLLAILLDMFLRSEAKRLKALIPMLLAGVAVPLLIQCAVTSKITGETTFSVARNDAFNIYLGQTRRVAVGCVDSEHQLFYLFHNNNAALKLPFYPMSILPVSILDRSFFQKEVLKLWLRQPGRQALYSLENAFELFMLTPDWPLRNNQSLIVPDLISQWLFFFFVTVPALAVCLRFKNEPQSRVNIIFLSVPIIGIAAAAFIGTGQPRYLVPFQYFFVLLAAPFYDDCVSGSREKKGLFLHYLIALLLAGAFALSGYWVRQACRATIPPIEEHSDDNYQRTVDEHSVGRPLPAVLFAELGKEGELARIRNRKEGYSVELKNFNIGEQWSRPIYWNVTAKDNGQVVVHFPHGGVKGVLLFFTDGDSYWRASLASSSDKTTIAQELHNGRWLKFPVLSTENLAGSKEINLRQLTGNNIALSAVLVY